MGGDEMEPGGKGNVKNTMAESAGKEPGKFNLKKKIERKKTNGKFFFERMKNERTKLIWRWTREEEVG